MSASRTFRPATEILISGSLVVRPISMQGTISFMECGDDIVCVRWIDFHDEPELLREERRDGVGPVEGYLHPAVACERHFEQGRDQTAVRSIVAGRELRWRR